MSNEELFKELEKHYSRFDLLVICDAQCTIFTILYEDDVKNKKIPSEHEYDARWWLNKGKEMLDEKGR